jgi:hypothetical protein
MSKGFSIFSSDTISVNFGAKENEVSIKRADLVTLVDSGIVYPRSKSVLEKEIKEAEAEIVISYTCVEHNCSYESALKEILQGHKAAELKAYGVQELTKEVVSILNSNPLIFPSSAVKGFVFQAVGKSYLYLRNDSSSCPGVNSRVGLIDLSDVKKKLIFEAMRQKEARSRVEEIGTGVLLGAAIIQGASWVMKVAKR